MLRSLLRRGSSFRIPALLSVHLVFLGAPCSGDDPPPTVPVDAGSPAPVVGLYQSASTDETVDPAKLGGENVAGIPCQSPSDARLGGGFVLSDPSVQLRELTPYTDGYRIYGLLHDGLPPQSIRVTTTCATIKGDQASLYLAPTTTAGVQAHAAVGKIGTASSSCGTDSWLVGGGFSSDAGIGADGKREYGRLTRLAPDNNAWVVRGRGLAKDFYVSAQAVCARRHIEVLYPHPTATFTAQPGQPAEGIVTCPTGWYPLSGGFAMDDDADFVVTKNVPSPMVSAGTKAAVYSGWLVGGTNRDSVARTITAIALCGRVPAAEKTPVPSLPPPLSDPPAAPKLDLSPNPVDEFCLNGQWPNVVKIKNVGTAPLTWSLTPPSPAPNLIVSPTSGTLAPDASVDLSLFGSYNNGSSFSIPFTSNGGSANLVVNCK